MSLVTEHVAASAAERPRSLSLAVSLTHLSSLIDGDHRRTLDVARAAEAAGVDEVVVSEHVALGPEHLEYTGTHPFSYGPGEPYLDPFTCLSAVAACTTRVRLGTNIAVATLRPAIVLAKMAATLDVMSGGRFSLGVGVGWHRAEFDAAAVPWNGVGQRLEDTIGACRALWTGKPATFSAETVSFADLTCCPPPLAGDVPVWWGGTAHPRTARRVARLGEGWTPVVAKPDVIAAGRRLIEDACATIGRDPSAIGIRCTLPTMRTSNGGVDLDSILSTVADFRAAGATIVQLPPLERLATTPAELDDVFARAVAVVRTT